MESTSVFDQKLTIHGYRFHCYMRNSMFNNEELPFELWKMINK